jgi:hypothetical protein
MRGEITLPLERHILTHKLILELSAAQVQRALSDELHDERDHIEVLWWQIYTAIERRDVRAQAQGLFELAQRIEHEKDAYALSLEATQRLCKGQHLDRRYRADWERVQLINPRSRMAWWAMTEQAFRYERDPSEYRAMLARLAKVSEEPRHRAQAVWMQALLEYRSAGKGRVMNALLDESYSLCDEMLTPSLLRQHFSPIKGRVVTIEVLDELSTRLPEGELRGDTLFRLALLKSADDPSQALSHAVEAGRHHIPEALELAEMLYRHLQTGEAIDFSKLNPELLQDLLGIDVSTEDQAEIITGEVDGEYWELDDQALAAGQGAESLSFEDEASFIEFAFEDEDDDEYEEGEEEGDDLASIDSDDAEEVSIVQVTEVGVTGQA